jgi:DNA-binding response OmpR family regulator
MAKIIVVEDNESIRESVSSYLRLESMEVMEFERLHGVLQAVAMKEPDLIILDVMLPDGNGFEFAKKLKARHHIPILFLTAKTSESDRITGFEIGADDYLIKPFSPRELTLRVKAILRRTAKPSSSEEEASIWTLDGETLRIEPETHRILLDGREIHLTAAEWKILHFLASHKGMVFSRSRLLGACLDYLAEGSERTVDTHVKNIRAKLGEPGWIETVRGFGYRFTGKAG